MDVESHRKDVLLKLKNDNRLTVTDRRTAVCLLMPTNSSGLSSLPWAQLAQLADATVPDVKQSVARLAGFGYFKAWDMPRAMPVVEARTVH
jgi:hypothetical protein